MPLVALFTILMSTVIALAYARAVAREQNRRPLRLAREVAAGRAEILQVRVVADADERTSLGSSLESAVDVSAAPRLTSEPALLEEVGTDQPRRFRLPPGQPLDVLRLPGAIRQSLRIETTEAGIAHRYSFELASDRPFWIAAGVAGRGEPYRDDDAHRLSAPSGGFVVAKSAEDFTRPSFGFGQAALVGVGVFALLSAASTAFRNGLMSGMVLNLGLYAAFIWSLRDRAVVREPGPEDEEARETTAFAKLRVPGAPLRVDPSEPEEGIDELAEAEAEIERAMSSPRPMEISSRTSR